MSAHARRHIMPEKARQQLQTRATSLSADTVFTPAIRLAKALLRMSHLAPCSSGLRPVPGHVRLTPSAQTCLYTALQSKRLSGTRQLVPQLQDLQCRGACMLPGLLSWIGAG